MDFKDERNKYNAKFGNDTEWSLNQRERGYTTEFGRDVAPRKKGLLKDKDGYYYRDPGTGENANRTEFGKENFVEEQQENKENQEEGKQNLECGEEKCPHCH